MIGCSILIPTYNRPRYLKRILSYYNNYEITYNIIVADSSSNENKRLNEEAISLFPDLSITHLNRYSSELNLFHKIADAVNYVDTKYCVACADDDFITPNGINQSVDFLEKNQDFTIAHGQYVSFYLRDDERGKQQFYWKPTYLHESILFPDANARLNYHLSNYSQATFYAVHRTDFMKMIWAENRKFTNDTRFGELLPTMLTAIHGKIKCLDVLYAARELIPDSSARTAKTLVHFIKNGTYNEKYAKFRDCVSAHLSEQAQLDIEESKKVVDKAMSAYMKKSYPVNPLISKMEDILGYLRLPDWIDKKIRALYRVLFLTKQKRARQKFDSSFSLDISPTYEYYDDLNKIRLHVLSHLQK